MQSTKGKRNRRLFHSSGTILAQMMPFMFIYIYKMSDKVLSVALFAASIISGKLVSSNLQSTNKNKNENSCNVQISREMDESEKDALTLYNTMRSCKDTYLAPNLNHALDVLTDACRLYGMNNLISSYNGGKDADVIMHLLRAVAAKLQHDTGVKHRAKLVYFAVEDEFPEVLQHIEYTKKRYNLDIVQYDCGIAQGLKQHVEKMYENSTSTAPRCAPAFVLGTRQGDPNCGNQETYAPSSNWMPVAFMRVNAILKWEYGHVWHFLRTFTLPYCSLYERGFTSLGKRSLTVPNPALRRKQSSHWLGGSWDPEDPPIEDASRDSNTEAEYWPAYMLSDWRLERAGRLHAPKNIPSVEVQATPTLSAVTNDVPQHTPQQQQEPHQHRSRSNSYGGGIRSAAMVIIGDEILNGFTADVNLQVAAQALNSIGIPLKIVTVISDDIEEIAAEVLRMSQIHDVVFTSGGIGPTHDDVTLKAIALALNQRICINSEMVEHLYDVQACTTRQEQEQSGAVVSGESSYPTRGALDETLLRFAMLPENSQLRFPPTETSTDNTFTKVVATAYSTDSLSTAGTNTPVRFPSTAAAAEASSKQQNRNNMHDIQRTMENLTAAEGKQGEQESPRVCARSWPVLQCENIFILPGVPQFFETKMELIVKHFLIRNKKLTSRKIVLDLEERALVSVLDRLVAMHREVKFGSYPFIDHPEFKTIITLEGCDRDKVEHAVASLLQELPRNAVLRVEKGRAAQRI